MGPRFLVTPFLALAVAACSAAPNGGGDSGRHDGAAGDGRGSDGAGGDGSRTDGGPLTCVDIDQDGIPDNLEHMAQAGVTGDSDDEDGDGFSDEIEGTGNYPNYNPNNPSLNCHTPIDCDADGIYNFLDTDSDNDGLTDAEERAHNTNPCAADTDGDGVDDLTEVVAASDPTMSSSTPPAGSLYVTLPYHAPGEAGTHEHRPFTFTTRIRLADVFILVDNSASMQPIIANLQGNLTSVIVPGVHMQIPDARIGIGSFDSVPDGIDGEAGHPGDYTLWIRQPLAADTTLAQAALMRMHTIDQDLPSGSAMCGGPFCGGDYAENQVEALFETIQGDGMTGHVTDEAARVSVHNALDPHGDGWVPQMDPARDCGVGPDSPPTFGWGCFQQGRVPILVLCSDAAWYNGYAPSSDTRNTHPTDPNQHRASDLTTAMMTHGAFFVGIDVGQDMPPFAATEDTFANSQALARATMSVDGSGNPLAFSTRTTGIGAASQRIVDAITQIAGSSRQDITTRVDPDTMEMRLMVPHTTVDFIKAVTPDHGVPDAPSGYDRKDATTFYNVAPTTSVVFDVDFYNDFQMQAATAQLFRATIQVLGRAHSIVDSRQVFIIVPAFGAQPPG